MARDRGGMLELIAKIQAEARKKRGVELQTEVHVGKSVERSEWT